MILLDTATFCEPGKRRPHASVVRWLEALDEKELFATLISIGEVEHGIAALSPRDPLRATRPPRPAPPRPAPPRPPARRTGCGPPTRPAGGPVQPGPGGADPARPRRVPAAPSAGRAECRPRNRVERLRGGLERSRAVAARHGETAPSPLASAQLASARVRLEFVHTT